MQTVITVCGEYKAIDEYIERNNITSVLLVCDEAIKFLDINAYFESMEKNSGIKLVRFSDFQPNPLYESVVRGVNILKQQKSQMIIAVGGGSAIDVAKCIKLYSSMNPDENYLRQTVVPNDIKLMAVPTTAGTGSEATRFAVIYYNGEKQSVSDYSCIPEVVVMDASVLRTLPIYQKKSTMLDAMCHAIESFWSVNSTDESKMYSAQAINMILENRDGYLANEDDGNANMLRAANIAGKAINITQTTAGHAMCYKLTSLYGIAHGHAAALCLRALFPYMAAHINDCDDKRGRAYLARTFDEIAEAMGKKNVMDAISGYKRFFDELELDVPKIRSEEDFDILKKSVNETRLKNNPVHLNETDIGNLYREILENKKGE